MSTGNDRVFKSNPPAIPLEIELERAYRLKPAAALRLLNLLNRIREKGQERGFGVLEHGSGTDSVFGVEWVGRAKHILCVDYRVQLFQPVETVTSYQLKRELAMREYDRWPFQEYTETIAFFRGLGLRWTTPVVRGAVLEFSAIETVGHRTHVYRIRVSPPRGLASFTVRTGKPNFATIN